MKSKKSSKTIAKSKVKRPFLKIKLTPIKIPRKIDYNNLTWKDLVDRKYRGIFQNKGLSDRSKDICYFFVNYAGQIFWLNTDGRSIEMATDRWHKDRFHAVVDKQFGLIDNRAADLDRRERVLKEVVQKLRAAGNKIRL